MTRSLQAAALVAAAFFAHATTAQSAPPSTANGGLEVRPNIEIARQGDAVVYDIDVDAHMAALAPADRSGMANSPKRIQQILSFMLMRRGAAVDARKLGLGADPITQREIEIAAEGILMRKRIEHLRANLEVPDMTQIARERYLAEPEKFKTVETVTVAHVLLKTQERTEAEARALIEGWKKRVSAGDAKIEEIAIANSDDPGVVSNSGLYVDTRLDAFVPEFAAAVRDLKSSGDLSGPVKTQFGIHLIQLRERKKARLMAFDEVSQQLIAQERERFITERQRDYLEQLKALPVEANEDAVFALRSRYNLAGEESADAAAEVLPKVDGVESSGN